MLNFMYSLQELSWKIKLDRIDLQHIFTGDSSRIQIKDDEARIYLAKDSYLESKSTLDLSQCEKNFNTDCFFLTLVAHHLTIIPMINKYQRRIRIIKDIQRVIDELKQTESIWKMTPLAARNQMLMEKWSNKIKVRFYFEKKIGEKRKRERET
jgi:ubiquitin conjugation factor E4 B